MLNENLSCAGRVIKDIYGLTGNGISNINLIRNQDFKNYTFRRLLDNEKYVMNNSPQKLKIFVIYGFALGSFYDSMYKEIISFCEENKNFAELYVISIDPVANLN